MEISKTAPVLPDVKNDDMPSKEIDIEKTETLNPLERQPSGPPYSVFSPGMKIWIIFLVSASATISPLGATTFLPALNVISDELRISATNVNISITTYMIAQAIAPAIIGGMSDTSGRRVSFIVCFVIFIIADVGLALQTSYAALLVLRVVQAVGCSAAIALSIAVVADLSTSAERGKYMGYASAGILLGPAFGPTIGGILAQYLGWRSTFWFLAIYAGVLLAVFVVAFPETCRAVVGNGSIPARGLNQSLIGYLQNRKQSQTDTTSPAPAPPPGEKRKFTIPNPIATLRILAEKESCIVLLYNGLFFTGLMVTASAIPNLFRTAYNLNELHIGLCYIASGVGALISSLTMGHIVDWNFRRHATALNIPLTKGKQQDLQSFPIERARLEIVVPGHIIGIIGLLAFGWTVKFQTHLAGPEIALFIIGFGITTAFNNTNALLIDLHRDRPAAATAAVNLVRCLMSGGGCAAIVPMCEAMNPGWAFTFIAGVYVGLIGVVFVVMRRGMEWRREKEERRRRMEVGEGGIIRDGR